MPDPCCCKIAGKLFNFTGVDGFDFPAPVIHGTANRNIMRVGPVKLRIDSGSAGDDHADIGDFGLGNGIGGQGCT